MLFEEIERPEKCRRHISDEDMCWDTELEAALLKTIETKKAIVLPLARFHSSPAKGRLWKLGYSVRHRVLPGRLTVGAWVEGEVK